MIDYAGGVRFVTAGLLWALDCCCNDTTLHNKYPASSN
jgi:hypothetical protein